MVDPKNLTSYDKVGNKVVSFLNFFAAAALAGMMFLTFTDVLLRYLFNNPIQGSTEIIEFLMAIVIPFSIVYCAYTRSHVSVDLIVENFSDTTRKVIDVIMRFLMIVLFIPVTWQSFIYIVDEYRSGLTSAVLYIPVYPFIAVSALAFLALTIILIEQFLETLLELVRRWTRS